MRIHRFVIYIADPDNIGAIESLRALEQGEANYVFTAKIETRARPATTEPLDRDYCMRMFGDDQ